MEQAPNGERMNPFKQERTGTLVGQEPDSGEYEIWFLYDRDLVRVVRPGSFVGVKNFDSREGDRRFSLLEIMEAYPTHYAIEGTGQSLDSAYPGFVVEAARSARLDWEQDEPTENTTIIRCKASSSGRELRFNSAGEPHVGNDDALPKIGEEAHLLSNEMMGHVINEGLLSTERPTISPGSLRLDEEIPYYLDVEGLLRTHFGVFGFTGAGKSNLLSTVVAEIMDAGSDQTIVFSDLMGEYTGLLIDLIHRFESTLIVAIGPDSLPGGEATLRYLRDEGELEQAVDGIINTMLLPRDLEDLLESYRPVLQDVLEDGKIQMLSQEGLSVGELVEEFNQQMSRESAARNFLLLHLQEEAFPENEHHELTADNIEAAIHATQRVIEHGEVPRDPTDWGGQAQFIDGDGHPQFTAGATESVSGSEESDLRGFLHFLRDLQRSLGEDLPNTVTREDLIDLMDAPEPTLVIVQSDYGPELKLETERLIYQKYNQRRRDGDDSPLVSFILDEADEFIPNSTNNEATARVRSAVETIARRGRKFGVGIGIATQRATYLDTNIMAQPHTYMISKLPRQADRQRVGEAFGLGEEVLDRTLDFNTGEWLTVSYEASGIDGFPIPVSFENANRRVRNYLNEVDPG